MRAAHCAIGRVDWLEEPVTPAQAGVQRCLSAYSPNQRLDPGLRRDDDLTTFLRRQNDQSFNTYPTTITICAAATQPSTTLLLSTATLPPHRVDRIHSGMAQRNAVPQCICNSTPKNTESSVIKTSGPNA